MHSGNRLLKISWVQEDHAGQFSCSAFSAAGKASRTFIVTVQGEEEQRPRLDYYQISVTASQFKVRSWFESSLV